ncbi:methionyl-tRNA formyltransferase [Filimonas effusa]|uniref:Methionyl-tRNA formyltransferase n=2 Tax=Filimonas effusa TaxID=2508721 RepID=A0A4Q1D0S2_9BACT|nr:methionyl-tRNA formyltransferase [Filimonas effusa]
MGTPEFAVSSLDALVEAGCHIVGVVTAPDKPAGRGMKLTASAVKQYAVSKGLTVLQPEKLRAPEFLEQLRSLQADIQVVVAFRMLPEVVWNMPPMGTINVHGSLLPQYRGAAPINWAVINGEKETGVTTFKLQHAIDTGNILLRATLPIGENDTAGEIHDRMKVLGANVLVQTIKELAAGTLTEIDQSGLAAEDAASIKHAPKIFTETCTIDWNKSTDAIHNLIRGLSPYPGAFTHLDGKILKIFQSRKETTTPAVPPGTVETDGKTFLRFATADGHIQVLELQLEGKKRMPVSEFLKGWRRE